MAGSRPLHRARLGVLAALVVFVLAVVANDLAGCTRGLRGGAPEYIPAIESFRPSKYACKLDTAAFTVSLIAASFAAKTSPSGLGVVASAIPLGGVGRTVCHPAALAIF